MFMLPGVMDPLLLRTDKRPPGSKERKRGLNPSPPGTRSGANFAKNLGFHGYGLGLASGKWAPGPRAGKWEIPFFAGRS